MRHPKDMHCADVREFLNDLALTRHVAPSTQKTALKYRVFVYRRVLDNDQQTQALKDIRQRDE